MATLVYDQFTGTDGTALTAHTPNVGGAWTAGAGTFKILSNKATPNSDADDDQAIIDPGFADFTISCDVAPTSNLTTYNRAASIIVRWSDSTHFWLVDVNVSTVAANTVELYQKNGTYSAITGSNPAFSSGVARNVTISCLGPLLSVYVDGALQFSYSSATMNQTSTKVGLRLGAAGAVVTAATWDNLLVLTPVAVQMPPVRPSFGPTRLLGLANLPVIAYPRNSPPSTNSVDVQKYGPPARLTLGPTRLLGLTGLPIITYPPNNPAPTPTQQIPMPPVRLQFGPTRLLGLMGLPVVKYPSAPAVAPAPPGPVTTTPLGGKPYFQRVPDPSDINRLARLTELLSSSLNSVVGKGQLQQVGAADWKIISGGFEAPRPPGAGDDRTIGATPGCTWVDTTAKQSYICLTNPLGSATWQAVGGSGGGGGGSSGLTGVFP